MSFWDFGSRRRAKALVAAIVNELPAPFGEIDHLPAAKRLRILARASEDLAWSGAALRAGEVADRLLQIAPDATSAWRIRAQVATADGRVEEAIDAWGRALPDPARDVDGACTLLDLLFDANREREAAELTERLPREEPGFALRRARALHLEGLSVEALELVESVCAYYEAELGSLDALTGFHSLAGRREEASRLRDEIQAEIGGRESLVVQPALAGKLDARAGINYRLLGESLMVEGRCLAPSLTLETPETSRRRASELLRLEPRHAGALALAGAAELRDGGIARAEELFDEACRVDGRAFGGFLGLGAVLDERRFGIRNRVKELPEIQAPPRLADIVPDLPALTWLERRVVIASAAPLGSLLDGIARARARIHILPIGVRGTDLSAFAAVRGERADDARAYDTIGGLAAKGCAIARVEGLLDLVTDARLTFAHELAHLALIHAPASVLSEVEALYARALEEEWAFEQYQLENPDEFFAESYCSFLAARYDLPNQHPADEEGLFADVVALFERFEAGGARAASR